MRTSRNNLTNDTSEHKTRAFKGTGSWELGGCKTRETASCCLWICPRSTYSHFMADPSTSQTLRLLEASGISSDLRLLPPSEHPPVLPADSPPLLAPGPRLVRPDARVQLEPHHPDCERRPRGAGCSKEARDPPGGARDKGETLGLPGPANPNPPDKPPQSGVCERERARVCVRCFKPSEVFYVCNCFPFCYVATSLSLSPLCKHWLTFLETSTASNVV